MRKVVVVIGAGQIGQAIARRVSVGKQVLLADVRQRNAEAAAEVLENAGYEVSATTVNVSSREAVHALVASATSLGDITGLIHAAGVSPSQASPATILKVDAGGVRQCHRPRWSRCGYCVSVRASSSPLDRRTKQGFGHDAWGRAAQSSLQPDQVTDSLHAYQISKRGNSLRVAAEAVRWGKRGARVNTISPGITITPLAKDELNGPRGEGYRRMIQVSAAGQAGTPDEVGTVGVLLMGPDGGFIMGSDFLMDGGVTAAYWYGELAPRDERSAETSVTSQNQTMTLSIRDVLFTPESGHRSVGLA